LTEIVVSSQTMLRRSILLMRIYSLSLVVCSVMHLVHHFRLLLREQSVVWWLLLETRIGGRNLLLMREGYPLGLDLWMKLMRHDRYKIGAHRPIMIDVGCGGLSGEDERRLVKTPLLENF
jgi:hypothetical protein